MTISWYALDRIVSQGLLESLRSARAYVSGCLLDVGCGGKPYEYLFADIVNRHVGVDLPTGRSPSKTSSRADVHADVVKGLPFPDGSFDTVLCTEVLEHVPEPQRCMREMHRVLKSGGYLVLTAPQAWGLHEEPDDFYRYTRYGLEYLAHHSGLEVIYTEPRGGDWAMVGQLTSISLHYSFADGACLPVRVLVRLFCVAVQLTCMALDELTQQSRHTLGHTIVARKP